MFIIASIIICVVGVICITLFLLKVEEFVLHNVALIAMKKRLIIIIFAFCVSFILMVALSLFSMERFTTFTMYSDAVDHSNTVIINMRSTEVSLRDIGLNERGYMITHDTSYLRHMDNAIDTIHNLIVVMGKLTEDNPEQQKNITLLKANIAMRIAAVRTNIDYVDTSSSPTPSKYYFDSRQQMIECSHILRDMRKAEGKLLAERFKGEQFYQALTTSILKYLLVIFCIITLFLFIVMIRELRSRMLYQEELQAKVIDLKRSHSELQEIAFAASHDLQEPLRKIQVFSNMLLYKNKGNIDEDNKDTLRRINTSASRMQSLISDITALTSLTNTDEKEDMVDLGRMLEYLLIDIDDKIKQKDATVEIQQLPIIKGYENQLKILFKAILDNSLKFTRDNVSPIIIISFEITMGHELVDTNPNLLHKKFYCITCSDNGIGFENRYISKMFRVFQRLHPESQYDGKGIGLAISQRIMANHEGYIIGHGEPGMGAKFKLFFPVED